MYNVEKFTSNISKKKHFLYNRMCNVEKCHVDMDKLKLKISKILLKTYDKNRGFQLKEPSLYLVYLVFYLSRETGKTTAILISGACSLVPKP